MTGAGGRRPLVVANWKMHKTVAEACDFVDRFIGSIGELDAVDLAVCPPFTALAAVAERTRRSPLAVVAQNMHAELEGAFTGEVSARMLLDAGATGVLLGHSERRQLFGETDEALAPKVAAALAGGLAPVLCVGETEAERDAGETEAVIRRQLEADLAAVGDGELARLAVAYEPVWAIGTGRTATADQAQEAIAFARSVIAERDAGAAAGMRILYGGSVKPANAAELMAEADVDGALVGGASLDPGDFLAICRAAA